MLSSVVAPNGENAVSEPNFHVNDCVDYRFSTSGPFAGAARVNELLSGGRYRLARLDRTPFRLESSIFVEAQLRLTTSEARAA
jgi:hypothetical protein